MNKTNKNKLSFINNVEYIKAFIGNFSVEYLNIKNDDQHIYIHLCLINFYIE
jgi:hypothetical protein